MAAVEARTTSHLTDEELWAAFEVMLNQMGGAAGLRARMEGFSERVDRMWSEYPTLRDKYPNKWVAMNKDGVAAVADTLDELYTILDEKGISSDDVYHSYINTNPITWIL